MSDDAIPQKRCPKCGESKPLEMFGKHKGKKDGLTSWCKQCLAIPKPDVVTVQPAEKRCNKCGETKPIDMFYKSKEVKDGTQARCKKCQLAAQSLYHEANREAILQRGRDWRARNREKHRAYSREWQRTHPEQARQRHKEWTSRNLEHVRRAKQAWARAHPDVIRAKVQRRRARVKENGGDFSPKELTAMRKAYNGICAYCKGQYDPDELSMDHVFPIDRGGRHEAANIVLACGICNSSKGNKTLEEWVDRWYLRGK